MTSSVKNESLFPSWQSSTALRRASRWGKSVSGDIDAGPQVLVHHAQADAGYGGGERLLAGHVTAHAAVEGRRRSGGALREDAASILLQCALEVNAGGVTMSWQPPHIAVLFGFVSSNISEILGPVRVRLMRIADRAAHRRVVGQVQHRVVVALDAGHVVAKVAAHASLACPAAGRDRGRPWCACRAPPWGVALDAKVAELAVRLALTALVHGDEHRVSRRVRVHAARPLAVVIRVATLARLGIAQLLAGHGAGQAPGAGVPLRVRTPSAAASRQEPEGPRDAAYRLMTRASRCADGSPCCPRARSKLAHARPRLGPPRREREHRARERRPRARARSPRRRRRARRCTGCRPRASGRRASRGRVLRVRRSTVASRGVTSPGCRRSSRRSAVDGASRCRARSCPRS